MLLSLETPFWLKNGSPWGTSLTYSEIIGFSVVDAGDSYISLGWNFSAGVISYSLFRAGAPIVNVPGDTTIYSDSNLTENTPYSYELRANYSDGTTKSAFISASTTKILPPKIISTTLYDIGTAVSFSVPAPTDAVSGDVIIVHTVHANTQSGSFNVPGWTYFSAALATGGPYTQLYYTNYTTAQAFTKFVATFTGSTANATIRQVVVRGINPMTTGANVVPFIVFKEQSTTTATPANSTINPVVAEPPNGFGTFINFQAFAPATSQPLVVTPLAGQALYNSNITSTAHSIVQYKSINNINDLIDMKYSINYAAQATEITIWAPGKDATNYFGTSGSGGSSGAASTSASVTLTADYFNIDDSCLIWLMISSGSSAVSISTPAGWAAPTKVIDSLAGTTGSRIVFWWTRPTTNPAPGSVVFNITYPSSVANFQGAMILKDTKQYVPVGVFKNSTTNTDSISTTTSNKTFALGFVSGASNFAPPANFTKQTNWSRLDAQYSTASAPSTKLSRMDASGYGIVVQAAEIPAAQTVDFTTTMTSGPAATTRSLITFTGPALNFGPPADVVASFAAFGIPL